MGASKKIEHSRVDDQFVARTKYHRTHSSAFPLWDSLMRFALDECRKRSRGTITLRESRTLLWWYLHQTLGNYSKLRPVTQ